LLFFAFVGIISCYSACYHIHLHPESQLFFMTGYCHQGYYTPSTEEHIQWCIHCLWINGHRSSSNYSV